MKNIERFCKVCNSSFLANSKEVNRGNATCCSLSCSAKIPKEEIYNKVCKHCGNNFTSSSKFTKFCCNFCKQKNYRHRSKTNISIRTISKLLDSSKCELCDWNLTTCDIHHIIPVSKGGKNEISNLIVLCPNHHRLADRNLISQDDLFKIIKDRTISSS